jgi:hypothetical protein
MPKFAATRKEAIVGGNDEFRCANAAGEALFRFLAPLQRSWCPRSRIKYLAKALGSLSAQVEVAEEMTTFKFAFDRLSSLFQHPLGRGQAGKAPDSGSGNPRFES